MKKFLTALLCATMVLGLTGCSSSSDEPKETKKEVYEIGETAEVDGIKITVNSTRIDEGYIAAADGTEYFVMDITLENTTDDSFASSSIMCYELKDADGRKQNMSITANLNGNLDTEVGAGEKASGEIAFEVAPEGALVLNFTPKFGDSIKFNVR